MASAAPAAAASEFPVIFLTRYGDVPPGYTGIIILPRPGSAVNAAAAEVLLPDFEAALRRVAPPLSIPSRSAVDASAVNVAAELLLQQPPDFEAALRRALSPLSIPSRSAVDAFPVNAAAEVLLQQPPDFEAALRRAPPPLSIPSHSAVNAAAEVLLPQPPDFEAALRRAPPPLSIPSLMSPDNLYSGELNPDNLDPGDRCPIPATKGSPHPDLGGKRLISASNTTSISTDPEGSSCKGSRYSNSEKRIIKEYYLKSHADKCKKVDWQHLCDTELVGRSARGVEGKLYKIIKPDDLISAKRAVRKDKNLPPKSDGAEGTEEEEGTATKTVQNPSKTAEEVQDCSAVDASEEETARRAQDSLLNNLEDAPPENMNGVVQDPSSSGNVASEGSLVDKTFKKVESGREEDGQEG